MAGYNGHSKSNNALDAEGRGCYPASKLAKTLGCKTGAIRALMTSGEWHHTASYYNETDYYDGDEAREIINQLHTWKPPATATVRH